ncbi:MAG: hypothetical protein IJW63_01425 [Lachnospiraceae bacterium]|nr:hypothetical protein [Lachnospiraceae bacterium]
MKLKRLFDYDDYKGEAFYLKTQSKYEIVRTVLYFAISISLFVAGIVATGDKMNLLTIVAILGCLPACKSAVTMIMFLRYKGCSKEDVERLSVLEKCEKCLKVFDLVFTTYDKNYEFAHGTICGNTVALYSTMSKLDEQACLKHLQNTLALDGIKNVTIKIFTDLDKYIQRTSQMQELEEDRELSLNVAKTLLSVSL